MLDGIPGEVLGALGPTALAGLAVLLVLLGKLIPSPTHDKIVASKDQQITDLKAALAAEVARGNLQAEQVGELLEHARTVDQLIKALPRVPS